MKKSAHRYTASVVDRKYPLVFLLPAIVLFTVFYVLPAFLGMFYSLTNATLNRQGFDFVGLANYQFLFERNGDVFLTAIKNQFGFALAIALGKTAVGLLLALFVDMRFRGSNALRALIYAPIMLSPVIIGILFNYILKSDGFLNNVLRAIGLGAITRDWLGDFDIAFTSVVGIDIWIGSGWSMVMILAALQTIPQDVLESARLDGANPLQMFLYVKLPYVSHAINLCALLSIVSGLKAFDLVYTTTGGGPGRTTELMTTFLAKALSSKTIGYPAAISTIQFLVITLIALFIKKLQNMIEERDL